MNLLSSSVCFEYFLHIYLPHPVTEGTAIEAITFFWMLWVLNMDLLPYCGGFWMWDVEECLL